MIKIFKHKFFDDTTAELKMSKEIYIKDWGKFDAFRLRMIVRRAQKKFGCELYHQRLEDNGHYYRVTYPVLF